MKSTYLKFTILIVMCLVVSSCAPKGYSADEAGFFSGLWHGFIIIFSLLGKLFGANIGIYAEHNSGFFYWLGFIMGIGGLGRGGSSYR